jgi:hypothetical protein
MGFTNADDACANIYATDGSSLPAVNSYSSIASGSGANPRLIEFINGGYTIGKADITYTDIVLKTLAGKGPILLKGGKQNLVTGYLGYPVATVSNPNDYRTTSLQPSDFTSIINALIADGNLISQSQMYNPADFTTPPSNETASLIYLYQTMSQQNLTSSQQSQLEALQAININFFGEALAEYCYYKRMYMYLLNQYFLVYNYTAYTSSGAPDAGISAIGGVTATSTADIVAAIPNTNPSQTKKGNNLTRIAYYLAALNSRMMDINGLFDAINTYYSTTLNTIVKQLEASGTTFGSQKEVQARLVALKDSSTNIGKLKSEASYRQGIIDYTNEKNRYANIMLGFYAFLNIAAIGVILNLRE